MATQDFVHFTNNGSEAVRQASASSEEKGQAPAYRRPRLELLGTAIRMVQGGTLGTYRDSNEARYS